MNKKSFMGNIDDETLAAMIDKTLNYEKNARTNTVKVKAVLFRVIPAAAMIALIIGFANLLPVLLNDIEIPIPSGDHGLSGAYTNVKPALPFEKEHEEEIELFVPQFAEKTFFEERVLAKITDERNLMKIEAYYTLKDPTAPDLTEEAREEMLAEYPLLAAAPMYIFDAHASQREINQIFEFLLEYTDLTGNDIMQMYKQYGLDTAEARNIFKEIPEPEEPAYYTHDEYDEHGNIIKQSFYNSADDSLGWWFEWEYDGNGNSGPVKESLYNTDGSLDRWSDYEYDENGNCTKLIAYDTDGSLIRLFEWRYDENGNCITEAMYNADGLIRRQDLEYDAEGNLIKGITYDGDDVIIGEYYN